MDDATRSADQAAPPTILEAAVVDGRYVLDMTALASKDPTALINYPDITVGDSVVGHVEGTAANGAPVAFATDAVIADTYVSLHIPLSNAELGKLIGGSCQIWYIVTRNGWTLVSGRLALGVVLTAPLEPMEIEWAPHVMYPNTSAQIRIRGGTLPYRYDSTNPSVMTVSASGLVHASAVGKTVMSVRDSSEPENGATWWPTVIREPAPSGTVAGRRADAAVRQPTSSDQPSAPFILEAADVEGHSALDMTALGGKDPTALINYTDIAAGDRVVVHVEGTAANGAPVAFASESVLAESYVTLQIPLPNAGFRKLIGSSCQVWYSVTRGGWTLVSDRLDLGVISGVTVDPLVVEHHPVFMNVGDSFQLDVHGGTPPYVYSSYNPSVISVTASGLTMALTKGWTNLSVMDSGVPQQGIGWMVSAPVPSG